MVKTFVPTSCCKTSKILENNFMGYRVLVGTGGWQCGFNAHLVGVSNHLNSPTKAFSDFTLEILVHSSFSNFMMETHLTLQRGGI